MEISTPDFDLIVIGSGPAGCAAALNSVRLGLSVLLITKCGKDIADVHCPSESLHPGITTLLDHLGAASILQKASTGHYEGIRNGNGIHYFRLGDSAEPDPLLRPQSWGTHINKSRFNQEFLDLAISNNVMVRHNESVTGLLLAGGDVIGIKTSIETITAKYVIDASGSKRIAGKLLKLKERFHSPPLLTYTARITGISPIHPIYTSPMARFIATGNGWFWIAPEDNGCCTFTAMAAKGEPEFRLPEILQGAGTPHEIKKDNRRWRSCEQVAVPGLLICGDAGFILDPAAGQGILNALYSAIKCSETVLKCIQVPNQETVLLNRYSEWFSGLVKEKVGMLEGYYGEMGGI